RRWPRRPNVKRGRAHHFQQGEHHEWYPIAGSGTDTWRTLWQAEHPRQPHRTHHVHHAESARERTRLRGCHQRSAAKDGKPRSAISGHEYVARVAAESARSAESAFHAEDRTVHSATSDRATRSTAR